MFSLSLLIDSSSEISELIGPSEIRNMMQFSSFESEVRPGVVMMTIISFSYLRQVHPSFLDIVAKIDHPVISRQGL